MATHALSYGQTESVFRPHEILLSVLGSLATLAAFFALLVFAGKSGLEIEAKEPPPPPVVAMKVNPVLDLALLKKGGKNLKPKLPEKWKKQPPIQRYEAAAAPTPKAAKTPPASSVPLAKRDAEPPPPDAEVAKEVDQVLLDKPEEEPAPDSESEEGAADGVKEGTETDPLKARAVSQYLAKIAGWFNARFRPPSVSEDLPCDQLKKMGSSVAVQVGPDRRITGYSVTKPAGNAAFDERVKSTMDRVIGEELPPPPPLYPDIVGSVVYPRFSGGSAQCD
jgi:hypothetical protein